MRTSTLRSLALLLFGMAAGVEAQAIPALRGVGEAGVARQIDVMYLAIEKSALALRCDAATSGRPLPATQAAVDRAWLAAQRALQARNDRELFERRLAEFLLAEEEGAATLARETADVKDERDPRRSVQMEMSGCLRAAQNATPPVSAIQTLVPDVAFTASYGRALQHGSDGGVGVNTNALGAAAGAAFAALGSQALQDYFTNNLAVGAQIPAAGNGKISSALGLGLGGVSFGDFAFWPALGIQEFDSGDQTLSSVLTAQNAAQKNWSQLLFGVAVPLSTHGLSGAIERICEGKLQPILSVGVSLPYYFPGDAYTALGAVFSARRSEYVHLSGTRVYFSVDVPLLRVGARPTYDREAGTCKPSQNKS